MTCLISTDDKSFTYNKHINRLSTVQEYKMIVCAVERGVPEEKIAQALSVDVASINITGGHLPRNSRATER